MKIGARLLLMKCSRKKEGPKAQYSDRRRGDDALLVSSPPLPSKQGSHRVRREPRQPFIWLTLYRLDRPGSKETDAHSADQANA